MKRTLVIALAGLVILAGLLVGGVRLLDHLVPGYRQALADRIGERIGADVSIEAIELRWQWRGPLLELDDVRITRNEETRPAVSLHSLGLHFSFADLIHGKRLPDGLVLDQPRLAIRISDDGRPRLVHWWHTGDPPLGWDRINQARSMLRFLHIRNARLQLVSPRLPRGRVAIDSLDASLRDGDGQLHWRVSADGPKWFDSLTGHGVLSGALPDVTAASFEVQAENIAALPLARANHLLDEGLAERLSGGGISAHLQGQWQNHRLVQARANLALDAIADTQQDKPVLPALSGTVRAAGTDTPGRISFVLADVEDGTDGIDGLDDFGLSGAVNIREPALEIDARHVPGGAALRLARLKFAGLEQTDAQAGIDNLSLRAGAQKPLRFGFDFSDLRIDDPQLSAGPLTGSYYQQAGMHVLQFAGAGGTLSVRRFMRGELAIGNLGGALAWHHADDGWQIDARKLQLASGEAKVSASGSVQLPDAGAPVVDIAADMSAPDMPRLLAHIPQAKDLPNERLRDWLPKAITAGRLDKGHLEITGPLDRFPFAKPRNGERFHLTLSGSGAGVAYKPDWPPLQNARGTLILDGDDLDIKIAGGEILGVKLAPSSARVANVREPVLHIDGHVADGAADRMLAFLGESPLRDKFGKLVDAIKVSGPADLGLDLRIPLKPGLGDVEVAGTIGARGSTLRTRALPGPITAIRGHIAFDDKGMRAQGLSGRLLGMALSTDLEPAAGDSQGIATTARLNLPENNDALAHYLPRSWLDYASGHADVHVGLQVARDGKVSDIGVTSNLTGMRIDLPAPLTKAPATPAPMALTVAADAHHVHLGYDHRLALDARLTDGKPTRVQALFNHPQLQPPDSDGIWIGGDTSALDAPGWYHVVRHVLAAGQNDDTADASTLAFWGGDLKVGQLRLDNRYFENAHLRAQPLHAAPGWRIDFEGPDTQGQVTWTRPTHGRTAIEGSLARLALKTDEQKTAAHADDSDSNSPIIWNDVSPLELPRLDIQVADLRVDDTDFRHASVQADALPHGWQLDHFSLQNGALTGSATGRWVRSGGRTRASAKTRLEGHGLADLMRTLGYPAAVRAETARIHASLAIDPNPNGLDLRALNGSVNLALDNGTLESVEPGAGRVLGLVNLYVLPRRLRLDFRDVVDQGMAFDQVRAQFAIKNGNAYGNNVRIETPSSKIHISGRIGLAARDYDERVKIVPKVGSGLAVASTVLGGPIVGAAVFAVQELLKKPIQKFSSIGYTLKGSWDDPQIAEPSAED